MTIHKKSHDKLLAELTRTDMENYCLDYDKIDIENKNTQLLVCDLLKNSNVCFDFSEKSRLFIDVIPNDSESIFVLITLDNRKAYKIKANTPKIACEFYNADILLNFLSALKNIAYPIKYEMYFDNEKYILLFNKNTLDKNNLKCFLDEFTFAYICDEFELAQLKEHSKRIK